MSGQPATTKLQIETRDLKLETEKTSFPHFPNCLQIHRFTLFQTLKIKTMKTLKILAALFFVTGVAVAQHVNQKDVPSDITDAFVKEYGNASDVEWEKKMENYKVDFDVNRMEHEVWYNASGTVVRKEQDITEAELSQAVREALKSAYAGYRLDDVERVWENNTTSYKLELEKGEDKHVTFDIEGKVAAERND